jgi:hypothetical protein
LVKEGQSSLFVRQPTELEQEQPLQGLLTNQGGLQRTLLRLQVLQAELEQEQPLQGLLTNLEEFQQVVLQLQVQQVGRKQEPLS